MEDKIKSVFFHELGHYLAHEMNRRFYTGYFGVNEIKIYQCEEYKNEFCGSTIPNKPINHINDKVVPKERLANFLIMCSYGCILQSIYQETELNHCFETNGNNDSNEWRFTLLNHKIINTNKDLLKLLNKYSEKAKSEKVFSEIFKLNPFDYLIKTNDISFKVNINKLEHQLTSFFNEHLDIYQELVNNHNEIILREINKTYS